MKKRSSIVWRFFDRLEDNKKCFAVLCKLCDQQYKFFGNTTNMRVHLTCKHPLQWELAQNGTLDESTLHFADDTEESTVTVQPRRKYKDKNVRYSVSVDLKNDSKNTGEDSMPHIEIHTVDPVPNYESDVDHQEDSEEILLREVTDEEWLEEETYQTIEPTRKRRRMPFKKIKREIESPPRRLSFKPKPERVHYEPERVVYQVPSKDEYSVFGEYVANKLRKVRLPKTRGNLQQLITTILWQAEYGMYDNADAVKRVLSYNVDDNHEQVDAGIITEPGKRVLSYNDDNHEHVEPGLTEHETNQSTEVQEEYTIAT